MEQEKPHQAGFVTIIGKPNVGKSTLMNKLVGERLSIITPKAQTTRHAIGGVVHGPYFQIVFTDTPGILQPAYQLQHVMMLTVEKALIDTDIFLWMVDATEDTDVPPLIQKLIAKGNRPVILLINKIDLLPHPEAVTKLVQDWQAQVQVTQILPIAALQRLQTEQLIQEIVHYLPVHPPYYPPDTLTDKPERFFAAEIIREQILQYYYQEIPYAVEVAIDSFQETDSLLRIRATIYVERKSQKAILIGKQGEAIKQVGIAARQSLECFFCKQVFLQQYVKVLPHWRNQPKVLQRLGYES
jgi:GTP-binding protein Era